MQTVTQNLGTLARTLLVAIGSYLVGHNVLGIAIDSSNWQIIAGTIMTIGGAGWGIVEKTATIESVESAVRSAIVAGSGVLVAAGKLSENTAIQITGLITAVMPLIQSALSKAKAKQVAQKVIAPSAVTGKMVTMPKLAVLIGLLLIGSVASAQSIFKPLPLAVKTEPSNTRTYALTFSNPPASAVGTWQGLRLSGPDVMAALPDFTLYTGVGVDYEWDKADSAGKWYTNSSVGLRVYGGANLSAPNSVQTVGALGIRVTFFNHLLAVGLLYNLTTKKAQGAVGNPAGLIPPIN